MTSRIASLFRAVNSDLLENQPKNDPELVAQAARVVAFGLASLLFAPLFALIYWGLGAPVACNLILASGVILIGIFILMRRGVAPDVCGSIMTGDIWFVCTGMAIVTGGIWSPATIGFTMLPVVSVLLTDRRTAGLWTLTACATIGLFGIVAWRHWPLPMDLPRGSILAAQCTGLLGVVGCIYVFVNVLKRMELVARRELRCANEELAIQATTDGLTGISNRHCFEVALAHEWTRHQRTGMPLSLALIDADYFKAFNDEYGHLAGDECLCSVALAIQESIRRPADFCARFGGEEFAVILPNTDEVGALLVAEEIRSRLELLDIPHSRSTVSSRMTVSIGIATVIPSLHDSSREFLNEADMALYRAKSDGRDRIAQAASQPVSQFN